MYVLAEHRVEFLNLSFDSCDLLGKSLPFSQHRLLTYKTVILSYKDEHIPEAKCSYSYLASFPWDLYVLIRQLPHQLTLDLNQTLNPAPCKDLDEQ